MESSTAHGRWNLKSQILRSEEPGVEVYWGCAEIPQFFRTKQGGFEFVEGRGWSRVGSELKSDIDKCNPLWKELYNLRMIPRWCIWHMGVWTWSENKLIVWRFWVRTCWLALALEVRDPWTWINFFRPPKKNSPGGEVDGWWWMFQTFFGGDYFKYLL